MGAQTRRGKASFYSKRATGARAASGERIHHDSLTCAHRTYPFGTLLKVTNLRNGNSVVVRVTDRGPHRGGRIIDLSYGAARELGMLSQGIAVVEIERVGMTQVPYRDDEVTSLPEFEFDFSKLIMPTVPTVAKGTKTPKEAKAPKEAKMSKDAKAMKETKAVKDPNASKLLNASKLPNALKAAAVPKISIGHNGHNGTNVPSESNVSHH